MSASLTSGITESVRTSIITNRLSHKALNDNDQSGFLALLQLDTGKSNNDFLDSFRNLKKDYPIVNQLCQRRIGWFGLGSLAYMCKGNDARAVRYREIIEQLKTGQQTKSKQSYFSTNENNKKSICQKVEDLKTEYLAKTYQPGSPELATAQKTYAELEAFNDNLGFKQDLKHPSNLAQLTKSSPDAPNVLPSRPISSREIWTDFTQTNSEYACLTEDNENDPELVNVHNKKISAIKAELLKTLKLKDNTQIFKDKEITESTYLQIRSQNIRKHIAARKIQRCFRRFSQDLREQTSSKYGYKHRYYFKPASQSTVRVFDEVQEYVVTENSKILPVPQKNPQANAPEGASKRLIGKTNSTVLLETMVRSQVSDYTDNKKEKIFLSLGIANLFITSHRIARWEHVAVNAGNENLRELLEAKEIVLPRYFKEILKATKILHQHGYYHLDIKPQNITVTRMGNTIRLKVIDMDSLASANKGVTNTHSPRYASKDLVNSRFETDKEQRDFNLYLNDTYAWIITMLELSQVINAQDIEALNKIPCTYVSGEDFSSPLLRLLTKTPEEVSMANQTMDKIMAFMEKHIKTESHGNFLGIVYLRSRYAEWSKTKIHLYDMLI